MNENINLCKILRDCPKGTKFWSPIFGDCEFSHINKYENGFKSITVLVPKHYLFLHSSGFKDKAEFNCKGAICDKMNECLLFPSKDQRDWSKWQCPKPKKPKFDPKTFKAFDRVLVKYTKWECRFFNRLEDDYDVKRSPISIMTSGGGYSKCVPYNDDTKHLVGTSDEAPEYYRYWED